MTDAITASLARQSGLLRELSIIANNMANASTDGFKREAAVFAEYISTRSEEPSMSLGSLRGHYTDLDQGTFKETGGVLDVAIEGEGWFAIARGDEVLLTRDGSFSRDAEGQLVTADGFPVLDDGGASVIIPESAQDIAIGPDGTVTADGVGVGQIGTLTTEGASLERVGGNLWRTNGAITFVENPQMRQGFIESSNVSPVEEMARLIETQRMYEAGAALQTDEHERLQALIDALGPQ